MKKSYVAVLIAVIITVAGAFAYHFWTTKKDRPYGYGFKSNLTEATGEIVNFSLLDHEGVFHELYLKKDVDFLVFVSHQIKEMPESVKIIKEIKKSFAQKKIDFFFINSNPGDERLALIEWAEKNHLGIPILMDPSQLVSEAVGLKLIPQVVVVRTDGWKRVYSGTLGANLQTVLQSLLNNQGVPFETPENAIPIRFEFPEKISFEKQIKPVITQRCLYCHATERGFLPFLDSHEKLKNWTAMSRETIMTDRMPPYSVDRLYGSYANDNSLTFKEKALLIKWIDQGAPYDGIDGKKKIPPHAHYEEKYKDAKPIYKASMNKEVSVPANGKVEYSYTQLGGPAPFDMWVEAIKFHSTNPRQLHHVSLMVTSQPVSFYEKLSTEKNPKTVDKKLRDEKKDGDIELFILSTLVNYEAENNPDYSRSQVFGAGKKRTVVFREGTRIFIKKGAYLIVESHHMGTGREETEKSTLDFFGSLQRDKSLKQLHNKTLTNWKLKIPPMVRNYKIYTGEWVLGRKIGVLSLLGHLHMRGRSVKLFATTPDGKKHTVASIPNYYYGWQTGSGLVLKEPRLFEPGTVFKAECTFDNSPYNPFNPDPEKTVLFGQRVDRTEMCLMHVSFFYPE